MRRARWAKHARESRERSSPHRYPGRAGAGRTHDPIWNARICDVREAVSQSLRLLWGKEAPGLSASPKPPERWCPMCKYSPTAQPNSGLASSVLGRYIRPWGSERPSRKCATFRRIACGRSLENMFSLSRSPVRSLTSIVTHCVVVIAPPGRALDPVAERAARRHVGQRVVPSSTAASPVKAPASQRRTGPLPPLPLPSASSPKRILSPIDLVDVSPRGTMFRPRRVRLRRSGPGYHLAYVTTGARCARAIPRRRWRRWSSCA